MGSTPRVCEPCMDHCKHFQLSSINFIEGKKCQAPDICVECEENYLVHQKNKTCVQSCDTGYGQDESSVKRCKACSVKYCKSLFSNNI